ncbi:MAG TPA: tetratricopeptide repeat protein [Ferruginibacter sp.]|nr:tetratricopeptide repeat protein [Ferruginibacter sp.]
MKKIIILFTLLTCINNVFSQSEDFDAMLKKIAAEKNDNNRIDLIDDFFSSTIESNPLLDMQNAQKLLLQSKKNKDRIAEAMALSEIGYDHRSFNTPQSLEYNLKATALAQETGNEKLIGNTKFFLACNYKDQADYSKAKKLYLSSEESASKVKDYKLQTWALQSLGQVYNEMNKLDSALMYAQRDYELCMRIHYYNNLSYTLRNLGSIQGKMGNSSLAISYFNLALQEGFKIKSAKALNWTYTAEAQYFHDINQNDSSAFYAKKAIAVVQNTAFTNYSIKPAKLLLDIYRNTNIDSAFKYSEMFRMANDSLFSAKTIQQTQWMTFEDEMRQKELAAEKIKTEEQYKQNLQYVLVAIGIIIFIILFLLLSRSFITNTRLIEFLGVMALLIVFEFLNLLLHPFLEGVTNHAPLLMLLALVCIGALLIPLHRRVEKWATSKLVEKNKRIRLAYAKKTIEKLEGKSFTT